MATRKRLPQLPLGLDAAAPDPLTRWRDGATVAFLGGILTLRLSTRHGEATLEGGELQLPLPPQATARQIQDAAESWLRGQALAVIGEQVRFAAQASGRAEPSVSLSFSARGSWVEADSRGILRCHWRLVEQPRHVIAQVIGRAVAALPPVVTMPDLFGREPSCPPRRGTDAKGMIVSA